jgi:hypothetical protein
MMIIPGSRFNHFNWNANKGKSLLEFQEGSFLY